MMQYTAATACPTARVGYWCNANKVAEWLEQKVVATAQLGGLPAAGFAAI